MKKYFSFLLLVLIFENALAQNDSLMLHQEKDSVVVKKSMKQWIAPAVLISVGAGGRHIGEIKRLNENIRHQVVSNVYKKQRIDDFIQYLPVSQVFLWSNLGFKPKHNIKERLVLTATSFVVMAASVNAIKYTTRVLRPDNSALNSFPSGHTATAFMGLELLWQEYKDGNIWIGVAGYGTAALVGGLRMYNNRHWLTDVFMGAGVGIMSVKVAYLMFPMVSRWLNLSFENQKTAIVAYPIYNSDVKGVGVLLSF